MSTLRLFVPDTFTANEAELLWYLLEDTRVTSGRATLARLPHAKRIELFLPPSRILHTTADLPPGGKKQARKLLPFSLDTILIGDAESQHLAFDCQGDIARLRIIDRTWLAEVLASLKASGIQAKAAFSLAELCPTEDGHLLWGGNGWCVRHQGQMVWLDVRSADYPPATLPSAPENGYTLHVPYSVRSNMTDAWQSFNGQTEDHDAYSRPLPADAINLLQGEFASGTQLEIDWSKLALPARLLGASLACAVIAIAASILSMRHEEAALLDAMDAAYKQAFPGTPVNHNARLLLASRLKAGQQNQSSDDSLGRLISLASNVPKPADIKLTGLTYDGQTLAAEYQGAQDKAQQLSQGTGAEMTILTPTTFRLTFKASAAH
ncbi:hypothetical protein KSF73_10310 [Burkholderiaceae bacterium DAT-1]|nr:hypothetical protein [Burkholderiaceae bacterium DAT-1]